MSVDYAKLANSLGAALTELGTYSANAAQKANNISAASQAAQGAFNQASADNANTLNMSSIANQYGFNSAMMTSANQYNTEAWNKAAAWNEAMYQKQMDFNREEAEKQRQWQTQMSNTQYQRAMADMEKAGLNPILAYGGIGGGVPGGATASVGGSSMSAANANMASGGLLGANTASESNYMGQMEIMNSTLAIIGAIFSSLSSAGQAAGLLGQGGEDFLNTLSDSIFDEDAFANYKPDAAYSVKKMGAKAAYHLIKKAEDSKDYVFRLSHAKG